MPTQNEQLRDQLVQRQVRLLQLASGLSRRAIRAMDASEPALRELIREYLDVLEDDRSDLRSPAARSTLDQLRRDIRDLRQEAVREARQTIEEEERAVVISEWEFMAAAVSTITGREVRTPGGRREAREIVSRGRFEGRTIGQWMASITAADANRVADSVISGVMQGDSRRDILRAAVGTRRLRGTDGATQTTRNQIQSISRGATTMTSATAREELTRLNDEVFDREVYTAVLDSRTTAQCRALDGQVFEVGEGPIPPIHHNCRSIRVPLIRGEDVPDATTYAGWLSDQPASFQDEVLGPTRGRLFREGGLELSDFVTSAQGKELTLAQLAQTQSRAFERAGLDPAEFSD